jgi:hypothetical protein
LKRTMFENEEESSTVANFKRKQNLARTFGKFLELEQ